MPGPLQGIVVVDLSRVLAGPWATQALADYGAEVIKIEKPGTGDDTRQWGPPWLKDRAGRDTAESAYYLSTNRGKKSVAIDLGHSDGQDLVRQLARGADVVVENFKVGGLAKYGLAYADIAAIKADAPVTAAQKQALADDFVAVAQGAKPSQASAAKLAEDLSAALASKPLPSESRARLVQELDAILNPAKYPQAKMPAIFDDIQAIFQVNGLDRKRASAIGDDVKALAVK